MRKNKSAIKRSRQAEEKKLRNTHVKTTMKTNIKKAMVSIAANDKDQIGDLFKKAVISIGQTASKKVIHKNNAARKISRLSKKVHKALQAKS